MGGWLILRLKAEDQHKEGEVIVINLKPTRVMVIGIRTKIGRWFLGRWAALKGLAKKLREKVRGGQPSF